MPNEQQQSPKMDSTLSAEVGQMKTGPGPNPDGRPFTFGEKLVGLDFNPSKNPDVDRAKKLCADLADLVTQDRQKYRDKSSLSVPAAEDILYRHTIGEILNAQMNVVKLLTLKP